MLCFRWQQDRSLDKNQVKRCNFSLDEMSYFLVLPSDYDTGAGRYYFLWELS